MSSLDYLLNEINLNASVVSGFLKDNGHAAPTLTADSPSHFPKAPQNVEAARGALVTSLKELEQLVLYPYDGLTDIMLEGGIMMSVQFIAHFKVAEAVPMNSPIAFKDLATKIGVPEQKLTRILRLAMTRHIFHEPKVGYVAHSAISASLVKSESVRAFANLAGEGIFPSLPKVTEVVQRFGADERADNSPVTLAIGKYPETPFESYNRAGLLGYMSENMKGTRQDAGMSPEYTAKGYDWGQFGSGTVVDIGGAYGQVSIAIARRYPNLKFIIQDMPREVEAGRAELPSDLQNRISFMQHDFFKPNPVKEASVYFMRMILHDWPDKVAIQILKHIVPAMGSKSKIVITEIIMPEPGSVSPFQEARLRQIDGLLMVQNGIERTMEQWKELFVQVDGRLRISKVERPEGSYHAIMEVVIG